MTTFKGTIRLSYRKLIDHLSAEGWERNLFRDTHREFYLQAQRLDPREEYETFAAMTQHLPNAEPLHSLVSTAAISYIRQLDAKVPDIVDTLGQPWIPFQNFRFKIRQSHRQDVRQHQVAIYFYSDPLLWIDTVNQHLLVVRPEHRERLLLGNEADTEMVELTSSLSISSFQPPEPAIAKDSYSLLTQHHDTPV